MDRTPLIYTSQLDRLKKDSSDLNEYIRKVESEGNQLLARKLKQKFEYLNSRISQISNQSVAA